MVVLFQYFITHLIPVKRQLIALVIGSLIYAFGYFTVGLANSFIFLITCVIIITIGEMIVSPTTLSYASIIADPRHKGRYLGFFNLSHSLGWSLAPLVGGALLDSFTNRPLFVWGTISAFAIVSAIGFFIFKSTKSIRH